MKVPNSTFVCFHELTKIKSRPTFNQHLSDKTGSTLLLGLLVFLVPEHAEHHLS